MEDKTKFTLGAVAVAALAGAGAWLGSMLGRRAPSPFNFGHMQQGHVWHTRKDGQRLIVLDEPAIWHLKDSQPVQGVVFPVEGQPEWKFSWLLDDGKTTSRVVLSPISPAPPGAIGRAYVARFPGRLAVKAAQAFLFEVEGLELIDRIVDMTPDRDVPRGGSP